MVAEDKYVKEQIPPTNFQTDLWHNKLPRKTHNIVEILRETFGELVYNQIVSDAKQDFFADVTSFYPGLNYPGSKIYESIDEKTTELILNQTRSELEWLQSFLK